MRKIGFSTEKYLKAQTKTLLDRIKKFERVYLEFGGKLCYDSHAERVLPGYKPDAKIKMLKSLKKNIEIVYCVSSKDLKKKVRHDTGLTYDEQTLKDIEELHKNSVEVLGIVVTRFEGEPAAKQFIQRVENLGIKVYIHKEIKGYPKELDLVVSEKGFGAQPYIKVNKPLVVVTGAGGGSGKMAFCLSQIYHEHKHGINSGFAKFETFPVWNLAPSHPVNIAYEAATADIGDRVEVDPYHLKAYGIISSSYNRDIENFEIMKKILERIIGKKNFMENYRSPTDMGVNMIKEGIINDDIVRRAAEQEIIRRYFQYKKGFLKGIETKETLERVEALMRKCGLRESDRKVVIPARDAAREGKEKGKGYMGMFCGAAIELPDGRIVKGKNSKLLHAESAAILNAIKTLGKIPDNIHLLSEKVLKDIIDFKKEVFGIKHANLNVEETLIALAISASANPIAKAAMKILKKLKDCEMHTTHMPSEGDEAGLRKLGLRVTTDGIPTIEYVKR